MSSRGDVHLTGRSTETQLRDLGCLWIVTGQVWRQTWALVCRRHPGIFFRFSEFQIKHCESVLWMWRLWLLRYRLGMETFSCCMYCEYDGCGCYDTEREWNIFLLHVLWMWCLWLLWYSMGMETFSCCMYCECDGCGCYGSAWEWKHFPVACIVNVMAVVLWYSMGMEIFSVACIVNVMAVVATVQNGNGNIFLLHVLWMWRLWLLWYRMGMETFSCCMYCECDVCGCYDTAWEWRHFPVACIVNGTAVVATVQHGNGNIFLLPVLWMWGLVHCILTYIIFHLCRGLFLSFLWCWSRYVHHVTCTHL